VLQGGAAGVLESGPMNLKAQNRNRQLCIMKFLLL